jgi:hypothetical protein
MSSPNTRMRTDPRALLDAHWPGPKALFYRLGSEIALAFLTDYPTPESAARLGEARMAGFLHRHAYRGGKTPTELLARLRSAPTSPTGLPPEVLGRLLAAQIQLLRTLLSTITALEAEIKRIIATHPGLAFSSSSPASARSTWPRSSPRSAPSSTASPTPNRPPPNAAPHPSPNHPARPPASTSAGPPTPAPARPSPPSRTTPEGNHHGPKASTATPEPAANAIPTPPASWPAPGSASSGPAGTPTPPTTPSNTPPSNAPPSNAPPP